MGVNKKIIELTLSTDGISNSDWLAVWSNNRTERVTVGDLATFIDGNDTYVTGGTFNFTGQTLTLSLTDGNPVNIDLEELLLYTVTGGFVGNGFGTGDTFNPSFSGDTFLTTLNLTTAGGGIIPIQLPLPGCCTFNGITPSLSAATSATTSATTATLICEQLETGEYAQGSELQQYVGPGDFASSSLLGTNNVVEQSTNSCIQCDKATALVDGGDPSTCCNILEFYTENTRLLEKCDGEPCDCRTNPSNPACEGKCEKAIKLNDDAYLQLQPRRAAPSGYFTSILQAADEEPQQQDTYCYRVVYTVRTRHVYEWSTGEWGRWQNICSYTKGKSNAEDQASYEAYKECMATPFYCNSNGCYWDFVMGSNKYWSGSTKNPSCLKCLRPIWENEVVLGLDPEFEDKIWPEYKATESYSERCLETSEITLTENGADDGGTDGGQDLPDMCQNALDAECQKYYLDGDKYTFEQCVDKYCSSSEQLESAQAVDYSDFYNTAALQRFVTTRSLSAETSTSTQDINPNELVNRNIAIDASGSFKQLNRRIIPLYNRFNGLLRSKNTNILSSNQVVADGNTGGVVNKSVKSFLGRNFGVGAYQLAQSNVTDSNDIYAKDSSQLNINAVNNAGVQGSQGVSIRNSNDIVAVKATQVDIVASSGVTVVDSKQQVILGENNIIVSAVTKPTVYARNVNISESLVVNGTEITGSGGGSISVCEIDGTPNVTGVTKINVTNGTLTDDGGGEVTITTGGYTGRSQATGDTITFVTEESYNQPSLPNTDTVINVDETGAVLGIVQKFYSNASSTPTITPVGSENITLIGDGVYFPNELNIMYFEWVETNEIYYWVVQVQ